MSGFVFVLMLWAGSDAATPHGVFTTQQRCIEMGWWYQAHGVRKGEWMCVYQRVNEPP